MKKEIAPIKLFLVGTMDDGTMRLQSQLMVGRCSVDFLIKDGRLFNWFFKPLNGVGFHEIDIPYVVITNKEEMKEQEL